jgi:NADPH-dependent 2,4-dienoyl-CoA reductase/sulfur reductase-like enzyme
MVIDEKGRRPAEPALTTCEFPAPIAANADTLASALMRQRRALVGRSFKYHRPRGILTAGPEEPNALVELRQRRAARAQYQGDRRTL